MKPEGEFTRQLWDSIQTIYLDLINHPFVNQLAKGTLPNKNFAHYLAQDILYIRDDYMTLLNLSEKVIKPIDQAFFKSLALDGIAIEQELHNHFLKHFKVEEAKEKSPVIAEYTRFLIDHSENSSYSVTAASLLPCFWVYNMVGKQIINNASENNIYQKWIDTYKDDAYEIFTKTFIQTVEYFGNNTSANEKKLMQDVFVQSTKFELRFFEESILIK